jgi:hypothetical protein
VFVLGRGEINILDSPQPVRPSDVAILDQYRLVVTVVSESSKEDAAGKQGYLQGLDIYPNLMPMPSIKSDEVRNRRREQSVEVIEEEDGSGLLLVDNVFTRKRG